MNTTSVTIDYEELHRLHGIFINGLDNAILVLRKRIPENKFCETLHIINLIVSDADKYPIYIPNNPGFINYANKPEDKYNIKKRKFIKLGRFIRRYYSNQVDIDDDTLEKLCSTVMSFLDYDENKFNVLAGNDIVEAYEDAIGGHSCMTEENAVLTEIYAANPNVVSLLIYNNKARALLWNTDQGERVLDRIYPNDKLYIEHYKRYVERHSIVMRKHNGVAKLRTRQYRRRYSVKLKFGLNRYVPYMDSFRYGYTIEDGLKLCTHYISRTQFFLDTDNGELLPPNCCECNDLTYNFKIIDDEVYCDECSPYH